MSEKKNGLLAGAGNAADRVVGDIMLGGIGQGAFLVHQIPGIKQATAYIGENIADGWNKAEARQQKGCALRLIQDLVSRKETPSAEEIRQAAIDSGVLEKNLDNVCKAAQMAVHGKAQALEALQRTGAVEETPPAASEVPLPTGGIQGTLQPAVG